MMSIEEEFRTRPPFQRFELWGTFSPPHHPCTVTPTVTVEFHRHECQRWINLSAPDDEDGEIICWTEDPSATLKEVASFHPSLFLLHDDAYRTLSPMLSALRLHLDPLSHETLVDSVIQYARRDTTSQVVAEIVVVTDHVRDETELTHLAAEQEEVVWMVPAGEYAVQELLAAEKAAAVESEDEKCMICMEELPRSSKATRMPCGHWFHGDCIGEWLKCSHYCPLCRYRMPI